MIADEFKTIYASARADQGPRFPRSQPLNLFIPSPVASMDL